MPSTHPDFPDGTEVINVKANSKFFGQRGLVYGSGPSKTSTSGHAVIFVRWPSGDRFKYFPKRLVKAPLKEASYKLSAKRTGKTKTQIHEVPPSKKRPTLTEILESKSDTNE